jgi:hypothetical protein
MKNIFLVLVVYLFAFGGNAQGLIQEYAGMLEELESNVSNKEFIKVWKKQKKTWESNCENATTVKQVSELTVEFISKVYEVKMLKAMIVVTDKLSDQSMALSSVYNILKENDLDKWSDNDKKAFRTKLDGLMAKISDQQKKQDARERALLIKSIMEDFDSVFQVILKDSQKGSFTNTIEGEKKESAFGVKVKFKAGKGQQVFVDQDNIYEFQVEFSANNDPFLAVALQESMIKVIQERVPEGFVKSNKYDKNYVKNEGYRFEFKAEKFVFTAKQSSVLIGAKKDGSSVVLKITEPVFKR